MSFPRHAKYVASGVKWLGHIPGHWLVKRVVHVAQVIDPQPDHRAPEIANGEGFPYVGIRDLNFDGTINFETARQVNEDAVLKQEAQFQIEPGDIVFCKIGTLGFPRSILPHGRMALSATLVLIKARLCVSATFLRYAMDSRSIYEQIEHVATGSTRAALGIEQIRRFYLAVPEYGEQVQISMFLDTETAKIDALVDEQLRLIELLKEKRKALISQAVTKGLNPSTPMKDSGVAWLGQVPSHWEVLALRRCAKSVETGGTPSANPPAVDLEDGFTWYTPGDFGDALILSTSARKVTRASVESGDAKTFPAGSVLVVSIGATLGKVGLAPAPSSANQQINAIIPNDRAIGSFLAWSLSAKREVMRFLSNASTIGIMNQEKTKDIRLALPPISEQASIASYLDRVTKDFDYLIAEAQSAVDLLQERRSALITAAVTGKIDVRGLLPQPEAVAA